MLLSTKATSGGVHQYSQSMLEALVRLDRKYFSPVIVYFDEIWSESLAEYGVESHRFERSFASKFLVNLFEWLNFPTSIWRSISRHVYDVEKALRRLSCICWINPAQGFYSYRVSLPAISAIHDLIHRYCGSFPEVGTRKERRFRDRYNSKMCQYSKAILVDSDLGKQQLIESYPVEPGKVHVLPFCVPPYIEHAADVPEDEWPKLPERYFFYPAQFWEHKNHQGLIRALDLVRDELPNIHLVFCGRKFNASKGIQQLTDQLGLDARITILEYVPDRLMPVLYKNAVAMVMPTYFGPTNIPPLEAMFLGCPVAVSDLFAARDQLGEAAIFFDPDDVEAIADVMRELATNEGRRQELISKGHVQVQDYVAETHAARFQDFLIKINNINL